MLCYLEGLTHAQAAQQLGWPVGTVESRLARARDRLRERMASRSDWAMTLPMSLSALPEMETTAAPAAWIEATARAATRFSAGEAAVVVASAHVASMARGMLWTMGFHQAKLAIVSLLTVAAIATGAMIASRPGPAKAPPILQQPARRPASPPEERKAAPTAVAPTTIKLGGRVVDPDGRPVAGAQAMAGLPGYGLDLVDARAAGPGHGRAGRAIRPDRVGR